jgi:hypothetical protein
MNKRRRRRRKKKESDKAIGKSELSSIYEEDKIDIELENKIGKRRKKKEEKVHKEEGFGSMNMITVMAFKGVGIVEDESPGYEENAVIWPEKGVKFKENLVCKVYPEREEEID